MEATIGPSGSTWRSVRAPIEVISLAFDRSFNDISDGMLYKLNGGSETHPPRLGGMGSV
jgi:hypothetical protein